MQNRFKVGRLVDHSGYIIRCTLTDKRADCTYDSVTNAQAYCAQLNAADPALQEREVNEYFV